ncbi:MAG: hypothetical protein ACRDIB_03715, partial [Ardenticatenaceae bacterium]
MLAACGAAGTPPTGGTDGGTEPTEAAPPEGEGEGGAAEEGGGPASGPTTSEEPGSAGGGSLQVAFVYVAPVGDLGWTYAHDQGRLAVEEEFGNRVETTYI